MHLNGIRKNDLSYFDLILLDPPFNQEYEMKILKLIARKSDIKPSCKIYLEHSKFTIVEVPEEFEILKDKNVGDVRALLLKKK